jgi:hypothetical protein
MTETADLTVAKRIVAELLRLNLLRPNRAEDFAQKLAAGKIKNEDWKLLADPPLENPTGMDNVK